MTHPGRRHPDLAAAPGPQVLILEEPERRRERGAQQTIDQSGL